MLVAPLGKAEQMPHITGSGIYALLQLMLMEGREALNWHRVDAKETLPKKGLKISFGLSI